MNTYQFNYKIGNTNKQKTFVANSYRNAIEKACVFLEEKSERLDLIGLTRWEDVCDECSKCNILLTDLEEIYD